MAMAVADTQHRLNISKDVDSVTGEELQQQSNCQRLERKSKEVWHRKLSPERVEAVKGRAGLVRGRWKL